MYVFWRLIVALLLTTVGLPFAVQIEANRGTNSEGLIAGQSPQFSAAFENDTQLPDKREGPTSAKIVKRNASNGDSSTSFWGWLTGRDNPDPCMMASVGGVVGGGALTGAFVGAGIGSIFTGPGTVIGAVVGGVAGLFGGVSIGHRAGAAVCDKSCGDLDQRVHCYT
ncbi:AAEL005966-PA [Aedes aegypti]|uniref:AAEL005966-PA n=2 Tax=Aedes aegypti TaxID=7159 RepID=A0A1S4FC60_AEDAE|nr:uncharacterized protein LOC5567304 [Aedes aegypti]EAT42504.1 AAEL005966-PA [Aedes aegypti]